MGDTHEEHINRESSYDEFLRRVANAKSKVGSLDNSSHQPAGGNIAILNEPKQWSHVSSKVGSLDAAGHAPTGGNVTIYNKKLSWNDKAKPKVGSLENIKHVPRGGDVGIFNDNLKWRRQSKVGSLEKIDYTPEGGNKSIFQQKLTWNAKPRVGSLEYVDRVPEGGDVEIYDKKLKWRRQSKVGSLENINHVPQGGDKTIFHEEKQWKSPSKVGSLDQVDHAPGGGRVTIHDQLPRWKAAPKVGSLENENHKPAGGNVIIKNNSFKPVGKAKVGSLENASHIPGGGQVEITHAPIKLHAAPKVGSLELKDHKPGGGDVRIINEPLNPKAESKIGSLDNFAHVPGGGSVHIFSSPVLVKARPRVGSLANIAHAPGGGDVRILNRPMPKSNFKAKSLENVSVTGDADKRSIRSLTGKSLSKREPQQRSTKSEDDDPVIKPTTTAWQESHKANDETLAKPDKATTHSTARHLSSKKLSHPDSKDDVAGAQTKPSQPSSSHKPAKLKPSRDKGDVMNLEPPRDSKQIALPQTGVHVLAKSTKNTGTQQAPARNKYFSPKDSPYATKGSKNSHKGISQSGKSTGPKQRKAKDAETADHLRKKRNSDSYAEENQTETRPTREAKSPILPPITHQKPIHTETSDNNPSAQPGSYTEMFHASRKTTDTKNAKPGGYAQMHFDRVVKKNNAVSAKAQTAS